MIPIEFLVRVHQLTILLFIPMFMMRLEVSIGTVLGLFYTVRPLDVKDGNGLICSREQMPNFEDKHVGRFVPLG